EGNFGMAVIRGGHYFDTGRASSLPDRVGVVDDVKKDLLQLVGITNYLRKAGVEVLHHLDAVTGEIVSAQLNGAGENGIELQWPALGWHLARETEKVLYDLLGTLSLLQDDPQILFCLGRDSRVLH